jgi:phospholipase C
VQRIQFGFQQRISLSRPHIARTTCTLALSVMVLAFAVWFSGCSSTSTSPPENLSAIQHTVFIICENHTFDDYFGTYPGADGATSGLISTSQRIPLSGMSDTYPDDTYPDDPLCNTWDCALLAIDDGKMDKFDLISENWSAYMQVSKEDVTDYWAYANHFVLADRYFTSMHGPSLPNHLFAVAAQSGGAIDNGGNPGNGKTCNGNSNGTVTVIDANGTRSQHAPCFDFPTFPDALTEAGISWKYYADGGGILSMIGHLYESP